MEILSHIRETLLQGDDDGVRDLTRTALTAGLTARAILDEALVAGMAVVGEKFKCHEIFLPEVLLAARAMYAGLDVLQPLLAGEAAPSLGKVVIGTVQGDLHDIGKNLVGIMLKGAGFDVIDLGHDVSPENFVEAAQREGAGVIGLSALLTTTMPVMGKVVETVRSRGLAGSVKVIIGGAPVSEQFARQIGADSYGYDAASAVERVRALLKSP